MNEVIKELAKSTSKSPHEKNSTHKILDIRQASMPSRTYTHISAVMISNGTRRDKYTANNLSKTLFPQVNKGQSFKYYKITHR